MGSAIRTLNMLSAVIMLAAGVYIQVTFWLVLSQAAQGLIGVTVLLYFFVQIDLFSRGEGNNGKSSSTGHLVGPPSAGSDLDGWR
jgi:hypothetical protein